MSRYTQLFANLKAVDDSWKSIGPQPAARVDEIEAKFGIQLPKSFRQFLTEVGGIEYPNHYFTSINDDYLDSQDGLIALEADHDADQWACLDLNRMVNGECPVVWYHAFEGRLIGDCASSFEEFFQRLVEEWTG
jgi:SMI1-KNR4 cell-wall